jgi:16S rRNA G966 N2-methylase RsmD
MALTSPPYEDHLLYTNLDTDIGRMKGQKYEENLAIVYKQTLASLKENAMFCIVVSEYKKANGSDSDLAFINKKVCEQIGFSCTMQQVDWKLAYPMHVIYAKKGNLTEVERDTAKKTKFQHLGKYSDDYEAAMDKGTARELISKWSKAGATILDPFAGIGTTLLEARKADRNSIGIDINKSALPEYKQLIAAEQKAELELLKSAARAGQLHLVKKDQEHEESSKVTKQEESSVQLSGSITNAKEREQLFYEIVKPFENRYLWLGNQYAREILYSVASWHLSYVLKKVGKLESLGIRPWRNLLFYSPPGWMKSKINRYFANVLLPSGWAESTTRITAAAFTGTADEDSFTLPQAVEKQFLFFDELAVITGSYKEDIMNILLEYTESHEGTVRLAKISRFNTELKAKITEQYSGNITFGRSSFKFRGDAVIIASTYDRKYLGNSAFQDRFDIIHPIGKLGTELTKSFDEKLMQGIPLTHDKELIKEFQNMLQRPIGWIPSTKDLQLPKQVYEDKEIEIKPRITQNLFHYKLFRSYWGLDTSDEAIMKRHEEYKKFRTSLIDEAEGKDKVNDVLFEYLDQHKDLAEKGFTAQHLIEGTGQKKTSVYNFLNDYCALVKHEWPRLYRLK